MVTIYGSKSIRPLVSQWHTSTPEYFPRQQRYTVPFCISGDQTRPEICALSKTKTQVLGLVDFVPLVPTSCCTAGEVPAHKRFSTWAKKVQQRPRPEDPLRKRSMGSSSAGQGALVAALNARNQEASFPCREEGGTGWAWLENGVRPG